MKLLNTKEEYEKMYQEGYFCPYVVKKEDEVFDILSENKDVLASYTEEFRKVIFHDRIGYLKSSFFSLFPDNSLAMMYQAEESIMKSLFSISVYFSAMNDEMQENLSSDNFLEVGKLGGFTDLVFCDLKNTLIKRQENVVRGIYEGDICYHEGMINDVLQSYDAFCDFFQDHLQTFQENSSNVYKKTA